MPVVMESNRVTIIVVYSGCGNYRPSKITADVFDNCFRVTKIRSGINIETMFVVGVTSGLDFFERRSNEGFHFIQECGTESIAKVGVVKMFDMTPEPIITVATFRKKAMDVWIPFEVSAEGM